MNNTQSCQRTQYMAEIMTQTCYVSVAGTYKCGTTLDHTLHLPALVHKLDTFLKELTSVGTR